MYQSDSTDIHAFVDADYAGDVVDRRSMSAYLVKLGDASVVWGSKKQSAVAFSTFESEYDAMTLAALEILWIFRVLREAGLDMNGPIPLRSDNQSANA